ncbi:hypothetical protein Bca4012_065033 [Brassica carinata]
MRALTDDAEVYASLDMLSIPWRMPRFMLPTLLRRCYQEGNPSTLYIKGVEYFYRQDRHVEGLALIKRAADAGYQPASYTYAMTTKIWSGDGDHLCGFTRETVAEIGKVWDWALYHIENSKAKDMCNRCFWIKEVALFLRDFKPSIGHQNFEYWQ